MIDKAVFLLREVRVSREEAVHALARYFHGAAFEDRLRCVHEAWDIVHGPAPIAHAAPSALANAGSFAAAHERHGFTD
ncbi:MULTISPECIES: hypothetical protein [Streptomyces]|uniref:Uncharacterized protein n=2 Tax=Streptomyces TaxID=1883 RepID=A0A5N6AIM3_9ACTN|nr:MULTISPECIES: hypothetical protein [Streptomyces]KAB8168687.1 hypothetical protein FH607_005475 [Streptomyces mimosae]KAB8178033.1 hypothetical protein FH609_007890 [Streptomyces sp. 3MP-14]RMI43570.1 hypothetical protein EBN88_07135 [Streptomyces triticirhizae]